MKKQISRREFYHGRDYQPGRDYDSTFYVMKQLKIKGEKHYDSKQRDYFKKAINNKQSIQQLVSEYEDLKRADRGITYNFIINTFLFVFVIPYVLLKYGNEDSTVPSTVALLSAIWGFGSAVSSLHWEQGTVLMKSKLQAYAEIICEYYNDKLHTYYSQEEKKTSEKIKKQ